MGITSLGHQQKETAAAPSERDAGDTDKIEATRERGRCPWRGLGRGVGDRGHRYQPVEQLEGQQSSPQRWRWRWAKAWSWKKAFGDGEKVAEVEMLPAREVDAPSP